jgi:hypothetical protein
LSLSIRSISWDYYPQVKTVPLDDYENYRPSRRSSYEMILSRELRDSMLRKEWDVSRAEIAAAIRDTIKIKNQRRQTVQNLNKDKVEELFEGASKKIFRSLMFKSSTTQELDMLNQQYMAVQEYRQQEKKLAQQEHQQSFGNGTNSSSSNGKEVVDNLVIVGLNIDDDEITEDFDVDDHTEHKDDLPSTAATNRTTKNPIMIVEDDDDADILMKVESMKQYANTVNSMTAPATQSSDRSECEQQQCKGENSSEDGSTNLNGSHHKVVSENNNGSSIISTATATTTGMGEMTARNVTEI